MAASNSVRGSWINGPNIQIGSAGNVSLAFGGAEFQVQWLQPTPRDEWVPRRQRTPSYLLDARREVVPFWRRVVVQDALMRWRDDPDAPASLMVVHGAGGRGKTRLANAFAGECVDAGWAVARGVSSVLSPGDLVPVGAQGTESVDAAGTLVVVDYADRWPVGTLVELVRSMLPSAQARVRVLLLARSLTPLRDNLSSMLGRLPVELAHPEELTALAEAVADRRAAFTQAVTAFSSELAVRAAVDPPSDLGVDAYGSVLTLHMSALAGVCAAEHGDVRPELAELSGYLLDHERRHWPLNAPSAEGVTADQAEDAVFLSTLFGPVRSGVEARGLLVAAGVADEIQAGNVVKWHDRVYPEHAPLTSLVTDSAFAPLRPDRFGEDFVAGKLAGDRRARELVVKTLAACEKVASGDDVARRCLIVLAATAERHEKTRPHLWEILDGYATTRRLSPSLVQTVISLAPLEICQLVENRLPHYNTDLLQQSAVLTRHIVDELPAATTSATRARYLNNLGVRLAEAGDKQGALAPAHEAVEHYRALAEADPAAYLPDLAGSLNNLGNRLAEAGDKQGALAPAREAVSIRRALAEADPAAYLPDLAMSLNNLGVRLAGAGDKQGALAPAREAVEHYRALAEADPAAYLPNLAASLWALAGEQTLEPPYTAAALDEALASAEEACVLYEKLTARQPGLFDELAQAAWFIRAAVVELIADQNGEN